MTATITDLNVIEIMDQVERDVHEAFKLEFFFASGHTYEANNVLHVDLGYQDKQMAYVNFKTVEGNASITVHAIDTSDLLYAVIHDKVENSTTIIHGMASKFDIAPTQAQAAKLTALAHEEALAEHRHRIWKEKEAAKYVQRKLKRAKETGKFQTTKKEKTKKKRK